METIYKGFNGFDVGLVKNEKIDNSIKNVELNQYIKIKSKEVLIDEYGSLNNIPRGMTEEQTIFCGKKIRVGSVILSRIKEANSNKDEIHKIRYEDKYGEKQWFSVAYGMIESIGNNKKNIKEDDNQITKEYSIVIKDKSEEIKDEMKNCVDKDKFRKLLALYANTSTDHIPMENVNKYLEMWSIAKYEYFLVMNKSLRYDRTIDVKIQDREMREMKDNLCEKFPQYSLFLDEFCEQDLIDNCCPSNPSFEKFYPKDYKKGMKVTKFLSKIIQDTNFDIELSKVLQSRYIKGHVTVSIDPCDYFMASINKNNWSSCYRPNGEHGTFAPTLMCDDSSIIIYHHNGNLYDYEEGRQKFKHESFKWRTFVNVDKNTCSLYFLRIYPSTNPLGKDGENIFVRNVVQELFAGYLKIENVWDTSDYFDKEKAQRDKYHAFLTVKSKKDVGGFHFTNKNGGGNHEMVAAQSYIHDSTNKHKATVNMGTDRLICPICGKVVKDEFYSGRYMICKDCVNKGR